MTKHAIVGLSLSLAPEGAPRGVGVHVVYPAAVDTPFLDQRGPSDLPDRWGGFDARRYLSAATKPYPPTRLANDVLVGLRRGRTVIPVPGSAGAIWRLYRWSPGLFNRVTARNVARERQAASRSTPV